MSRNKKFVKFWTSREGEAIIRYVQSSCLPEDNEDFGQALLNLIYERDLTTEADVEKFLNDCRRSLCRILTTL